MTNYATAKQIAFIHTLSTERVVPQGLVIETSGLTISGASNIINTLMSAPRKAAKVVAPTSRLDEVPSSKYALEFSSLSPSQYLPANGNDLLFVEVRTWKGRKSINRLHGAPGYFRRTRIGREDAARLAEAILKSPLEAAVRFGKHHGCCGSCGAPLTDAKSRELNLGPECRKKFGL